MKKVTTPFVKFSLHDESVLVKYLVALFLALLCCSPVISQEKSAAQKNLDHEVLRVQWILSELVQPEAKDKIELTAEQIAIAKKAFERLQKTIASYDHVDPTTAEGKVLINELYLKIAGQGKEIEQKLVPEQIKKLNSMYYTTQIRKPLCFGLTDKFVVDVLSLSKEQQAKIDAIAKQTQEKLNKELARINKKVAEVRKKHLEKALENLSPKQRKAYLEKFWPKEDGQTVLKQQ